MRRGRWGDIIGVGVGLGLLGALVWAINSASKPAAAAAPSPAPPPPPTQHGGQPAGVNTELTIDGTNWPTQNGRFYRVAGRIRGNAGASDAETALGRAGFTGWTTYPSATPADWPAENLPPLSKDEVRFRGDGSWSSDSELPSALFLTPDPNTTTALIVDDVWLYTIG